MEFLFDLLPLLAIYVLVRVFARKRNPPPTTESLSTEDGAPPARTGFEQLLEALAAAQAEAGGAASSAPPAPADVEPTLAGHPAVHGTESRPRKPKKKASALQPAATVSRGRPTAESGRYYDDETVFDRVLPTRTPDAHAGIDAHGFSTASFVEHGLQRHARLDEPVGPTPRAVSGIAARLRNPQTAREAFEIQMLLERRGRSASEQRRLGASPRRPTR